MNIDQFEKELDEETLRVQKRKEQIDSQINILEKNIILYTFIAWTFVFIGIFIAIYSVISFITTADKNDYKLNLLGDFLGGSVASLWSLAGLFFIYVAFLGQKQQLLYQQIEILFNQLELRHTRHEIAGQKFEMQSQNHTLMNQKFENTFFNLLNTHNSIVNSLDIQSKDRLIKGRDCFIKYLGEFNNHPSYSMDETISQYLKFFAIIPQGAT